jgi:hypothetical protein
MFGCFAEAISKSASQELCTLHCMFDWPEQIHTSPTSTFLSSLVLLPLIEIVAGFAFAGTGSSFTVHLPSAPALPLLD